MSKDRTGPPGFSIRWDELVQPRSVALFGASPDSARPATRALHNLLRRQPAPHIYPVNPRHTSIAGLACLPDAASLPEVPDLAIVAVRSDAVLDTVAAAADRGTRTFVIFSSGFAELDDAGEQRQRRLRTLAHQRGLTLVGPNSLGVVDFARRFYGTFGSVVDGVDPPAGSVALVSQSGAIGSYVCAMAHARGFGFSHMVSTGNEAALDAADLATAVLDEPVVRAVALYLEGVGDGANLIRFFALARRRGVPVVLLRAGDSAGGQAAARSHTGALAGSARVSDAVLRRYGVVGVSTPEDLVVACEAVVGAPPWGGRRVGVLTGSGGGGVLVTDSCTRWGLDVPALSGATRDRLRALLPAWASVTNPVDVTATVLIDPSSSLDTCLRVLAEDESIDELVVFMGAGGSFASGLAERIVREVPRLGVRCSVIWLGAPAEATRILGSGGVPVFTGLEDCVRPIALLAVAAACPGPPEEPSPDAGTADVPDGPARFLRARQVPVLDEDESKTLLALAGVTTQPRRLVLTADQAGARIDPGLRFPIAVKVLARDIAHKSASGGVVLGVGDADDLAEATFRVYAAGVAEVGTDRVRGVLVEEMAPPGVEVIVGVVTDPVFGRVIAVGPGGVLAELIDDVTLVLPPAGPDEVRRLLAGTRVDRLLAGSGSDRDALCELVAQLADLVGTDERTALPGVRELDLNPVLVHPDGQGVTVVDCLVVLDADEPPGTQKEQVR